MTFFVKGNVVLTKKRRKFRHGTREQAESAVDHFSHNNSRNVAALNGVINGNVQWLPKKYGDQHGYYKFGIVPRRYETILLVTYYCPATGQLPHTATYDEEWLDEEIGRRQLLGFTDKQATGYREGMYDLRRFVNDNRKE